MTKREYKEYLFRKYDIEYDVKDRMLIIKKSINIKDFMTLKDLLKEIKLNDIRVN